MFPVSNVPNLYKSQNDENGRGWRWKINFLTHMFIILHHHHMLVIIQLT